MNAVHNPVATATLLWDAVHNHKKLFSNRYTPACASATRQGRFLTPLVGCLVLEIEGKTNHRHQKAVGHLGFGIGKIAVAHRPGRIMVVFGGKILDFRTNGHLILPSAPISFPPQRIIFPHL